MKRLFWGFVKIAVVVLLLVWASRVLFPEKTSSSSEEESSVQVVQETEEQHQKREIISEEKDENNEVENKGVEPLFSRAIDSQEPQTEQQKKYVSYSLRAGRPEKFTTTFTAIGTEPLSLQIARVVGEPLGEWHDLSLHPKTFWVLAELTLQGVNVDAAGSFHGAIVTVQEEEISVDTSSLSPLSSKVPVSVVSSVSSSLSTNNVMKVERPTPPKKTSRRMSVRTWEKVLQSGSR